jgi:two-component system cell cycle response regulator
MRIVVVDPSRTVLKIVTGLLQGHSRAIHPFTDGPEALAYIKSNEDVDALITSVELPSMSGLELCREVRLLMTPGRSIYIVLMSSNYEQNKLIEALDNGADDFIGKPPAIEELYARFRAAKRLRDMQRELFRLAMTDSLTGLLNRRAFFEQAEAASIRVAPNGDLCAVIVDIDNFKSINDQHGHHIGDRVLKVVASDVLNGNGIVGRLGGEEFVIVTERKSLAESMAVADRIRQALAALRVAVGDKEIKLTGSFGVSAWENGDTIDTMLQRADVALYKAKRNGRNCVIAADPTLLATDVGAPRGLIRSARR